MTKLTETQATILATAAQHPDGIAAPPASLPPAPRGAVAKAMIKAGLLEIADDADAQHPRLAWKLDGGAMFLCITDAGLRAIGVAADVAPAAAAEAGEGTEPVMDTAAAAEPPKGAPEAPDGGADEGTAQTMPANGFGESLAPLGAAAVPLQRPARRSRPAGLPGAARGICRPSLRDAARAVLAAWDAPDQPGLTDAVAALRAALPAGRTARPDAAPRTPRQGTKQEAVLALLRRPEGASVSQIAEATGWQRHTVRGFFAGLRKRQDIAVSVLERVRQVGPGQEGAKGSFSIYRIAEAG